MELIIYLVLLVASNALTAFGTFKVVQIAFNMNKQATEGGKVEIKGPIAAYKEKKEEKKIEEQTTKAVISEQERLQSWFGPPDYLEAFKEEEGDS